MGNDIIYQRDKHSRMGPVSMIYYFIPLVTPTHGDIRYQKETIPLGLLYFARTVTIVTVITDNMYLVSVITGTNYLYSIITILISNAFSISIYSMMYSETLIEISCVTISVRYLLFVCHGPHPVNNYE